MSPGKQKGGRGSYRALSKITLTNTAASFGKWALFVERESHLVRFCHMLQWIVFAVDFFLRPSFLGAHLA